jgi:hypothetical protein
MVSAFWPRLAQNSLASSLTSAAAAAETPPPNFAVFFETMNLSELSGITPELAHPDSSSSRVIDVYFKTNFLRFDRQSRVKT